MNSNFAAVEEKFKNNRRLTLVLVIVLIIALIPTAYFYNQYLKAQALLKNPSQQAQAQADALVVQIGKLIELPKGEKPTVATVSDIAKLADQPFFANAKNGDRVLIYALAKKAILYRPSENKIIEVAPVNLGGTQTAPTTLNTSVSSSPTPQASSPTPTKTYNVAIYNGTLTAGLAASTQKAIENKSKEFTVSSKGDASKSDYTQTLVVDIAGVSKSAAGELAGLVGGKVGSLPSGEKVPSGADFLVILGSSK